MSKSKVFTVYDSKAEAYLSPFFMMSRGMAIRAFTDSVNDGSTMFSKHPADYTLFEIGEYDELKGCLVPSEVKVALGTALEYKKKVDLPIDDIENVIKEKKSSEIREVALKQIKESLSEKK